MGLLDGWLGKGRTLIRDYEQHKEAEKSSKLAIKESELERKAETLNAKSQALTKLDSELKRREAAIKSTERRPFRVFLLCFALWAGTVVYVLQNFEFMKIEGTNPSPALAKQSVPDTTSTAAPNGPSGSIPYLKDNPTRADIVSDSYRRMEMTNPKFDVGRYCLNEEKKGTMTFEQCMGMAVLKDSASKR